MKVQIVFGAWPPVAVAQLETLGLHSMRPLVNGQIKASTVRVVSEDGADIGVFSLRDALALVASRREDLVEIDSAAKRPVCQAIDYGKFRYRWLQDEKKRRGV